MVVKSSNRLLLSSFLMKISLNQNFNRHVRYQMGASYYSFVLKNKGNFQWKAFMI